MFSPRTEAILDHLIDLPVDERARYLDEACAGDAALREEVCSLAAAFEASEEFLRPASRGGLRPADRVGRYLVLAEIGRGAMGVVYLVEDPHLGRNVALKTLTSEAAGNLARRARLRDEARMLAAVSQPNVAQVYSFEELVAIEGQQQSGGAAATTSFLTMEYVPGATLAEKLRSEEVPLNTSLELGRQIAAALEAAHAQGVVHRDLKPQNIRVTPDGWVKVLDFGLAFTPETDSGASGRPCGTVGYMSPEQARGDAVGEASDLWSFGCVLYECLARRAALDHRSTVEAAGAEADERIDWSALPQPLAPSVVGLLRDLLSADISQRPSATYARRVLDEELLRLRARALFGPTVDADSSSAASPRATPTLGNLPRRLSEFVGRERALAEVSRFLQDHRWITLTGPGGAGKTRLALEAAARASAHYPDGVWFIDLSTIENADQIDATAARAFGLRDSRAEAVARFLADHHVLIVVDNCEHLLEAANHWITGIIESCRSAAVLATSRAPLGSSDEQVFPLAPLGLPAETDDLDACRASEAVRLFASRARSRQPSFQLRDEQLATVVEICRRTDGLPLAIEIAAGHSRALPADEILARLRANPLSLGAPVKRGPHRHRSLAGVVRWSYRLLNRAERLLFERLSVFRGGWTLESAEAVCASEGLSAWQQCDLLTRLVERSLVEVDESGEATETSEASEAGHPGESGRPRSLAGNRRCRYRFLETIQRFARDRLARREGEPETTEGRYVDHLVEWLAPRAHEQGLSLEWLGRIDLEHTNLADALEICLRRGWVERAYALSVGLHRYWSMAGTWREGAAYLRRVLALPLDANGVEGQLVDGQRVETREQIAVWGGFARILALLEDRPAAAEASARLIEMARQLGDPDALARALRDAGAVSWFALDIDGAEAQWRESHRLFEQVGDRAGLASSVGNLAAIHGVRGQHAEAKALFEEQLRLSRELGDRLGASKALLSIGRALEILRRPEEALAPIQEALEVHSEARDAPGMALCLHNLGDTFTALGRFDEGRAHLLESLRIRSRLGNPSGVCSVLLALGRLADAMGDPATFAEMLGGLDRAYEKERLPLLDGQRKMFDATRRALHEKLGDEAFAAAYELGARRSLTQLMEWAGVGVGNNSKENPSG